MNIEHLLAEEIEARIAQLKSMKPDSDEYKAAIDGIAKLTDRLIEIEKVNDERNDKDRNSVIDKKDRMIKNAINVAGIIVPAGLAIWGTLKSLRFEINLFLRNDAFQNQGVMSNIASSFFTITLGADIMRYHYEKTIYIFIYIWRDIRM